MENSQKASENYPKVSNSEDFSRELRKGLKKIGISDSQIKTVSQPTDEYVVVFRPFEKKSKPPGKQKKFYAKKQLKNDKQLLATSPNMLKEKTEQSTSPKILLLPLNPAYGINLSAQEALRRVKQFFKIGKK